MEKSCYKKAPEKQTNMIDRFCKQVKMNFG